MNTHIISVYINGLGRRPASLMVSSMQGSPRITAPKVPL